MKPVTDDMKIKAIAPWFGSKRTLAPIIVEELGKHRRYLEPFCGSMSVLLAKPESRMETVNDLHGDVVNLARVCADTTLGTQLYRRARRLLTSDDLLAEYDNKIRDGDWSVDEVNLDRALAFFISSWMGRNGEVGLVKSERGRYLSVRWTANGGDPATRYASAVTSIPEWRRRLRNVTILRRDAFTILEKIGDDAVTAVYVDPPYLIKSDRYLYDFSDGFMGEDDHARLAKLLGRFKHTRVVVSYYAHARLQELYPGWTVRDCSRSKNLAALKGRVGNAAIAAEVLLINGPSYAKEVA
jgi:DNA adenine methylase